LTEGLITVRFMQHVGFCSCFPYFELEFNINSLFLYRFHTKHNKTTTHVITKWNVWSTWNKVACVTVRLQGHSNNT
jgi:hypothetical protein